MYVSERSVLQRQAGGHCLHSFRACGGRQQKYFWIQQGFTNLPATPNSPTSLSPHFQRLLLYSSSEDHILSRHQKNTTTMMDPTVVDHVDGAVIIRKKRNRQESGEVEGGTVGVDFDKDDDYYSQACHDGAVAGAPASSRSPPDFINILLLLTASCLSPSSSPCTSRERGQQQQQRRRRRRHVLRVESGKCTYSLLKHVACQEFDIDITSSSCCRIQLKLGIPPFVVLNDKLIQELKNHDRVLVKVVVDDELSREEEEPTTTDGAATTTTTTATTAIDVVDLTKTETIENYNYDSINYSDEYIHEKENEMDKTIIPTIASAVSSNVTKATAAAAADITHGTMPAETLTTNLIPFGTFIKGRDIYRNKLSMEETNVNGHYTIQELVLPNCTFALATTFFSDGETYLREIFGETIPNNLLVITPSSKEETPNAVIGKGILLPMEILSNTNNSKNWYWFKTRPHTEGCLHSKLLIFRSGDDGLRVIVSGNNLSRHQQQCQRDCFWIQDFPTLTTSNINNNKKENNRFQKRLVTFLNDLTKCDTTSDQQVVTNHITNLLYNIDFSNHQADIVYSFPRQKSKKEIMTTGDTTRNADDDDVGGYKQLAMTVADACIDKKIVEGTSKSILYATSGSMGNLEPYFIWQMQQAMRGITINPTSNPTTFSWNHVHNHLKCFWPSVELGLQSDIIGLHCLRHIPKYHIDKIPKDSFHKMFHDAIPNPPTTRISTSSFTSLLSKVLPVITNYSTSNHEDEKKYYPTTHGKFMLRQHVLYVGSHNFSRAAWGLRGSQPKNVELGVILVSNDKEQQRKWIERLPCQLVEPNEISPSSYVPFNGVNHPDFANRHPMGRQLETTQLPLQQQENLMSMLMAAIWE